MKLIHNSLIIGAFLIVAVAIIVLTSIRDESIPPRKFNCRMLIGSWHPDVPPDVIEACRKKGVTNDINSKTNYR